MVLEFFEDIVVDPFHHHLQHYIVEAVAQLPVFATRAEFGIHKLLEFVRRQVLIGFRQDAQPVLGIVFQELLLHLVAGQREQVDTVLVVDFGERHREHAARVACPVGVPDMLSFVYVPAGEVVGVVAPTLHVHLLLATDDDLLAGVLRGNLGTFGIHVGHHHQRQAGMQLAGPLCQLPQEAVHPLRVVGIMHHVGTQIGHRQHHRLLSGAILYRDDEVVVVVHPVSAFGSRLPGAVHGAAYLHLVAGEQRSRCLEARSRVVVARRDDNLDVGASLGDVGEELVVGRLRRRRRVAVVEHVARDKERVGLLFLDLMLQPLEKMAVFRQAVVPVEHVAQMPVTGGYYLHSLTFLFSLIVIFPCKPSDSRVSRIGPHPRHRRSLR